ncbi:putative ribonuclease H protein [Acorus gramineus]|uniref:Ribonuclease H protein n=1 Tax=Acorus gramineus TaxID=55184 RepID=A0AAV9BMW4_ACOGR|nr:putative ribonuclease H protein [Acorus gramineus]
MASKKIEPFTKASNVVSHLLFADDLILFTAATTKSGKGLKEILDKFAILSGLELNRGKSQVFYWGRADQHPQFVAALGIEEGRLPVTYLGLPLFTWALSPRLCLPLVDKLRKRLQLWHGHILSLAGRLELAKSTLLSFQNYWSAAFLLPRGTIKAMEKVIRSFIWGGPTLKGAIHHVKWDTICSPKAEGGLGLKHITDWVQATAGARLWEVLSGKESLWVAWVTKRYLSKQKVWEVPISSSGSWAWPHILSSRTWIQPKRKGLVREVRCPMCKAEAESIDHLSLHCSYGAFL